MREDQRSSTSRVSCTHTHLASTAAHSPPPVQPKTRGCRVRGTGAAPASRGRAGIGAGASERACGGAGGASRRWRQPPPRQPAQPAGRQRRRSVALLSCSPHSPPPRLPEGLRQPAPSERHRATSAAPGGAEPQSGGHRAAPALPRCSGTMGCCTGRCTLIFLCTLQLVSGRARGRGQPAGSAPRDGAGNKSASVPRAGLRSSATSARSREVERCRAAGGIYRHLKLKKKWGKSTFQLISLCL